MDTEHKKVLHKNFNLRMKEHFPRFVASRMRGGLRHACPVSDSVEFVVYLSSFKDESFNVWIGKEFDGQSGRELSFPTDLAAIYRSGSFTFPLTSFWSKQALYWFITGHRLAGQTVPMREVIPKSYPLAMVEPKINLLIDDVIDKLQVYGLPYFERVGAGLGIADDLLDELLGARP